ncbi:MAG: ZIP family metal transporter, partial [Christensenellales bacterium]
FAWITIFALGAMAVNSVGILVIYKNKEWAKKAKEYFMCFAAGVLITSPLVMAFPEALSVNTNAGLAALAGFMFMYFSNKIIKLRTKQSELAFGVTAIEGILIHSLLDGAIYTVTFSVSALAGVLVGIGLVMHEFAEGVITFSVLLKSGEEPKKAAFYAFLAAALTTPIGAFVAYPFISRISSQALGIALGFVAGVLIYVSASHLLPETREHEKKHSTISFLGGIALVLLIMLLEG